MKHLIILTLPLCMVLVASCQEVKKKEEVKTEEATTPAVETSMYIEAYDNGQPKIKGALRNGEREGLWVAFYENGVRWSEDNYIQGIKEGRSITFFPSGIIRYRGQYQDDKKIGLWQFYDETGKLAKEVTFE